MRNILFLCVANSARSQMAEGLARHFFGNQAHFFSAGSRPGQVNPLAIRVMKEIGIDISSHRSKFVEEINAEKIDFVITLCAEEVCPLFLGKAKRLRWPFLDPACAVGSEEAQLEVFREIRDQIKLKLEAFMRGDDE